MSVDIGHGLTFHIRAEDAQFLTGLYIHGFMVTCDSGTSVENFLITDRGIERQYLERKVSTVFVDGSPVDDMGSVFMHEGMTLALSSAMPGLAGATLRRGGYLSSMRKSITCNPAAPAATIRKKCSVTVKLFNILAEELGPAFLVRGICLKASDLLDLLTMNTSRFKMAFFHAAQDMRMDGRVLLDLLRDQAANIVHISLK
ncbi:MAG: hypothetical protein ACYDHW_00650 [Syntrophorhabdaceae bacterium]